MQHGHGDLVVEATERRGTAVLPFVDLTLSTDKTNVIDVGHKLQSLSTISLIQGDHDLMFRWTTVSEFEERVCAIHRALVSTGATYRVHTVEERLDALEPVAWAPLIDMELKENPAYRRKQGASLRRSRSPSRTGHGERVTLPLES
jgi:hypothetical protein